MRKRTAALCQATLRAPISGRRRLVGLLLITVLTACGDSSPPPLVPGSVARPAFSGRAAWELADTQVAFGPRVPGTGGHAAQLVWMQGLLAPLADEVVVTPFTHTHSTTGEVIEMSNVMARFNPQAERRLLLMAHWDTRPTSDAASTPEERAMPIPGANDGASGTAVLLHAAQLFAQQPPSIGVDLLFVDGEDYGPTPADMFLGAKHYARTVPRDDRPEYGVLVDLVGDSTPNFPIESFSNQFAGEIAQRVWSLAGAMGMGVYFPNRVGQQLMDDHVPLNQVGIPTIDIIDFDNGPANAHWHTQEDDMPNLSAQTLALVGELVLELVYLGG